jgi:hypothetical protein
MVRGYDWRRARFALNAIRRAVLITLAYSSALVGKLIAFSCAVVSSTASFSLARSLCGAHPLELVFASARKNWKYGEGPLRDHALVGEVAKLFEQQSDLLADWQRWTAVLIA